MWHCIRAGLRAPLVTQSSPETSPPDTTMRFICTSDLHLGRRSSLPSGSSVPGDHSAVAAWDRVVGVALEQAVDLVIVAGDLVDQANRFFEAHGPLHSGLSRLTSANIPVLAIAGNHDHQTLPSLAETFSGLTFDLLGREGRWTQRQYQLGHQVLEVVGWSFPDRFVETCPVPDLPPSLPGTTRRVGIVHGEVGQSSSRSAPLPTARLEAAEVDFWVAGHYHTPGWQPQTGSAAGILVPGSPQALDPGAVGVHGPWLVRWPSATPPEASQCPLSTIRYEYIDCDITGLSADQSREQLVRCVREALETACAEDSGGVLEHLVCRVNLVGRSNIQREIQHTVQAAASDLEVHVAARSASVGRVLSQIVPDRDLEELARAHDPVGHLARILLELETGEISRETRDLLGSCRTELAGVLSAPAYAGLDAESPSEIFCRDHLLHEGRRLLETLLDQKVSST